MVLPKQNRLRSQQEFTAVYKYGIRHTTPHLALRALHCKPQAALASQPTRIGIVVSQKVSKRAVVRNRIRRQLQAACRQLLPRLSSGWFTVIIVRTGAFACDYHQFLRELEQLLVDTEIIDGD